MKGGLHPCPFGRQAPHRQVGQMERESFPNQSLPSLLPEPVRARFFIEEAVR